MVMYANKVETKPEIKKLITTYFLISTYFMLPIFVF